MPRGDGCEDAELIGERLRAAADALVPGPAPVAELLDRGRRARRRRRLATAATAVATAGACLAATLLALPDGAAPPPAPAPPVAPAPSPEHVRVAEPGEEVTVAPDVTVRLSPDEDYRLSVSGDPMGTTGAESPAASTSPLEVAHWTVFGRVLYHGVWRSTDPPSRITVGLDGREYPATLLALPGDPGWGVFFLDATDLTASRSVSVTAYGADGRPFASESVATGP
ncbi:hypothetical protein [Streptomyces sp. NPDC127098]|uniref:hypothetical protein n=1 Tax=Streptomyces sp. NPDC127098 TaxID=3347137 RepID=UPI003659A111